HKALDARHPILCGVRKQGKPADHRTVDHIVQTPEPRGRPLSLEDFEVVAMKRSHLPRIVLLDRKRRLLGNCATPGSVSVLPGEAVLLTRRADDPLGILV